MIVKICGITTADDALHALGAGADWIGLNLVAGSRRIGLPTAQAILVRLPNPAAAVVLVELHHGKIDPALGAALRNHGVRRLQLYGDVNPTALEALADAGFESIVVQPVGDQRALDLLGAFLSACRSKRPDYLLCDAASPTEKGGTGRVADWQALRAAREGGRFAGWPPILLAGGLTPENVAQAVGIVAPAGVDVSSGVESSPGRKDPQRVAQFIRAARPRQSEKGLRG